MVIITEILLFFLWYHYKVLKLFLPRWPCGESTSNELGEVLTSFRIVQIQFKISSGSKLVQNCLECRSESDPNLLSVSSHCLGMGIGMRGSLASPCPASDVKEQRFPRALWGRLAPGGRTSHERLSGLGYAVGCRLRFAFLPFQHHLRLCHPGLPTEPEWRSRF